LSSEEDVLDLRNKTEEDERGERDDEFRFGRNASNEERVRKSEKAENSRRKEVRDRVVQLGSICRFGRGRCRDRILGEGRREGGE